MTDETIAAYKAIIADLESEITGHRAAIDARRALIEEANRMIEALRRRMLDADGFYPSEPRRAILGPSIDRPQKGDVKDAVLITIRNQPGVTGSEVANLVADRLETGAKDKRKLVFSTISYLVKNGHVRRDGDGLQEIPLGELLALDDPDEGEFEPIPY